MGLCRILLPELLFGALILAAVAASEANSSCNHTCGSLYIPYPFGTGGDCCLDPYFFLTCNYTFEPPKLFLGASDVEVLNISLNGELRVSSSVASRCYDNSSSSMFISGRYPVSHTRNKFTAVGCETAARLQVFSIRDYKTGCMALCDRIDNLANGSCSGIGCCQSSIPKGMHYFSVSIASFEGVTPLSTPSTCGFAFVVEEEAYNFSTLDLKNFQNRETVPMVLDWAVGEESCTDARKNMTGYACKAANSECHNSTYDAGYLCTCSSGYQGNPYLLNGCQDINECDSSPCVFGAKCSNSPGSFGCFCPKGQEGDGMTNGSGCRHRVSHFWIIILTLGIVIVLVVLIVGGWWRYREAKERELNKHKEKLFKKNGGLVLRRLRNHKGSAEGPKIFSIEELKIGTKNFDEKMILGQGGDGIVYKGVLADKKVVAIKKSKFFDHRQVEQFINEVFLLSQVDHRNVVKLLGCCLETIVPLLVYEFITNGTLFNHIHNDDSSSFFPWKKRLKIATEVASAVAYLHSKPIVHRDIKTANILLDGDFTAKVADFGVSKQISLDQTQVSTLVRGTFGYLDPEYLQSGQLSKKSDVYSFGIVIAELLTSKKVIISDRSGNNRNLAMCFVSMVEEDQIIQLFDTHILEEDNVEELKQVATLVKSCLSVSGEDRPSMTEVATALATFLPVTDDGSN